jgi:hypothetical protein
LRRAGRLANARPVLESALDPGRSSSQERFKDGTPVAENL